MRHPFLCILVLGVAGLPPTAVGGTLTISSAATKNVSCSGGLCNATAARAVLNATQLENILASQGADVQTESGQNLVVAAPVTWSTTNGLTLNASRNLQFNSRVVVGGAASVLLQWRTGGTGSLIFGPAGRVSFENASASLSTIGDNGFVAWTFVTSIASLQAALAANSSGKFALAADYDASGDGTFGSSPLGNATNMELWGFGNAISNLKIDDAATEDVGLFKDPNAIQVRYLRLVKANIRGGSSNPNGADVSTGGIAGYSQQSRFIGDSVSGKIVAGYDTQVGGIVGESLTTTYAQCESTASITAGGGKSPGSGAAAGGIVGAAGEGSSSISQSFASGPVTVGENSAGGGLVGVSFTGNTVSDSYATGAVTGASGAQAGGLIGRLNSDAGTVSDSYSSGAVTDATAEGGFVGDDAASGVTSDGYWDTTTSGMSQAAGNLSSAPGITGLTTTQLQSGLPAGFSGSIWAQKSRLNNGFPYLRAAPP